jgi:acetylglutamate kinase
LTDERFLEVWTDYKSGKMKERLQEEFSKSGIEVKGLKIEIENFEKVNETKKAIESR